MPQAARQAMQLKVCSASDLHVHDSEVDNQSTANIISMKLKSPKSRPIRS